MKTDSRKKEAIKFASQEQENVRSTRRTLKVLQHAASDKENLVGRPKLDKEVKLSGDNDKAEVKRKKFVHKAVQTDNEKITVEDLTSEEASENYWKILAEKRADALNDSLLENERLKENIETLQEENKICKEMLEESKNLVEVLQEMIGEIEDTGTNEVVEEATEN